MGDLESPLLSRVITFPTLSDTSVKKGALGSFFALGWFVAVRSLHLILIDISKTDDRLPYAKTTPCVINSAVDIVAGNFLALAIGGKKHVRQIWQPEPLKVFGAIAAVYAFSDFLEMRSMELMSAAAYQILLQSKLIITAAIVWALRGLQQTALQWSAIFTVCVGTCFFILCEDSPFLAPLQPIGVFYVLAKVFVSSLCAVVAERHLRQQRGSPLYVQVAQMKFMWLWVTLALTYIFDRDALADGFFTGWDQRTVVVAVSWVCKGWSTFLVLKRVDYVLRNVGDVSAILTIYLFDVFIAGKVAEYFPVHVREFRLSTFLMVLTIGSTVLTYTMAPAWKKGNKAK